MAAGQGDTGRNLIQSELNAADSGSARYVEALYWRAVLARTAADAGGRYISHIRSEDRWFWSAIDEIIRIVPSCWRSMTG